MDRLRKRIDSYLEKTCQYSRMSFDEQQTLKGRSLYADLLEEGRALGRDINALPWEEDRNELFDRMIQAVLQNGLPLGMINVLAEIS